MTSIPGEMFLLLTHESGRQEATQYRRQALVAAVHGARFEPEASGVTVALCMLGIVAYTSVFGAASHATARRLVRSRKLSEEQRSQIGEANRRLGEFNAQLERAREAALAAFRSRVRDRDEGAAQGA